MVIESSEGSDDQGQGLHKVWLRIPLWDELSFLPGLSAPISSPLCFWGCWGIVGKLSWAENLRGQAEVLGPEVCVCWLDLDLSLSMWSRDLVWVMEVEVLMRVSAEWLCERGKRAEKVASRTGPSQRPFPSGPRNCDALCRQLENPSWKEYFWPPIFSLRSLAFLCRKRTVCSRISAFSTFCCVPPCSNDS